MKLHAISFGCQMNAADAEEMSRPLVERGWRAADGLEDADAVLVNTCTVREHAEHRAVSLIGRLAAWKEARPGRLVIVAGCAAERLKDGLQRRFPHVDLVVGAKSIEQFPAIVEEALRERYDAPRETREAFGSLALTPSPAVAYVTIMRGCNYSCSYCIVPSVRGRELYRPLRSVLEEIRAKAAAGAREILLLGQTVNSYRSADENGRAVDFADLLRAAGAAPGVKRVRFMSPHPYFLTDRVIAAMAETPQVARHIHLPVQSGSDRILKAMRRNYTRAQYLERLARLRAALPGVALTTDLIVGFPGETEEDFRRSLALVEEADFDTAYCFKFSPREGTEACGLEGTVPETEKEERLQRLLLLVERRSEAKIGGLVGRRLHVLVEEPGAGRAESHWKVRLEGSAGIGELVAATVTSVRGASLTARLESEGVPS